MSKCKSNMYFSEQIYEGMQPTEGDTEAIIQTYSCTLKKGKTMTNVMAFESIVNERNKALGAKSNAYRWLPYMADVPADLIYLVVYDDILSFGSGATDFMTSPGSEAVGAAAGNLMDCNSGLYGTRLIHAPAGQ